MTYMNVIDIKPCPFCGNENLTLTDNVAMGWMAEVLEAYSFTVNCSADELAGGCGATCGYHETGDEAIEAWNTRAGKPYDMNADIDAAEARAAMYDGDDRECIKADVMNAFFAGARFARGTP